MKRYGRDRTEVVPMNMAEITLGAEADYSVSASRQAMREAMLTNDVVNEARELRKKLNRRIHKTGVYQLSGLGAPPNIQSCPTGQVWNSSLRVPKCVPNPCKTTEVWNPVESKCGGMNPGAVNTTNVLDQSLVPYRSKPVARASIGSMTQIEDYAAGGFHVAVSRGLAGGCQIGKDRYSIYTSGGSVEYRCTGTYAWNDPALKARWTEVALAYFKVFYHSTFSASMPWSQLRYKLEDADKIANEVYAAELAKVTDPDLRVMCPTGQELWSGKCVSKCTTAKPNRLADGSCAPCKDGYELVVSGSGSGMAPEPTCLALCAPGKRRNAAGACEVVGSTVEDDVDTPSVPAVEDDDADTGGDTPPASAPAGFLSSTGAKAAAVGIGALAVILISRLGRSKSLDEFEDCGCGG